MCFLTMCLIKRIAKKKKKKEKRKIEQRLNHYHTFLIKNRMMKKLGSFDFFLIQCYFFTLFAQTKQ